MKWLLCFLALALLAAGPVRAGGSVSVHVGGGYGGLSGHHGYSGGGWGGRGYGGSYGYGGGSYYGGGCYGGGYFGGGYAVGPSYGYGYGYGPGYGSFSAGYGPPVDYGTASSSPGYAPIPPANSAPESQTAPAPGPAPLAVGKIDEAGYVHSPFSTTVSKVDGLVNGQILHDPVTGQAFTVRKNPPVVAPPTSRTPTGKLDEFGYVHSPYSTFTFKVQNGNYAQVFHDPFTGQAFSVVARQEVPPHMASAQAAD